MTVLPPRAEARVDLAAIRSNVETLRRAAPSAALLAVVKADAYGHGLIPCARAARAGGAAWLGTALVEEALALRAAGDVQPILSWLLNPGDPFDDAVSASIDLSASAPWVVDAARAAALSVGQTARLHLKVDTGLGRSGASVFGWTELLESAARARDAGSVEIVGIWSHFAHADDPTHPTIDAQIQAFEQALSVAAAHGVEPSLRHLANSAATLVRPDAHYDLVRPGLAVYGLSPMPLTHPATDVGLRPAMTLLGRVSLAKRVAAGQGVSYLHRYTTDRETTLALIPLGYADGIPRAATNVGPLLVAGRRRTIAGTVCMDQFMVDVGDDEVLAGDPVVLFGPGTEGEPTVEDWAKALDTINYEVVTRIGPRVVRTYAGEG